MSRRYECSRAPETMIEVLSGRDAVMESILTGTEARGGEFALVLGDPYASAFALIGTPGQLRDFLAKAGARLDEAAAHAALPAELDARFDTGRPAAEQRWAQMLTGMRADGTHTGTGSASISDMD